VLASNDLCDPCGRSARALTALCDTILPRFPDSIIELVVLHPLKARFEWTDIPACVKKYAEMRFHGCAERNAYQIYGIPESVGALSVVRPDGVVGVVEHLESPNTIAAYLSSCLVSQV
jgi:phenol 2-monooxygenase